MPQNKSTNTFEQGLIRVDNKINQPKNSYSYALNTVVTDKTLDVGSRSNEKDFKTFLTFNPGFEYNILGYQWLGKEEYVLFIKEVDNTITGAINHIYLLDPTGFRLVFNNANLNFRDSNEISTTYRTDYRNHRIVYFVDGLNDDRAIDVDLLIGDQPTDVNLLSLQTSYSKSILDVVVNDNDGGNIPAGQYFIALSYGLTRDNMSSIFGISKPISISQPDYLVIPGATAIGTDVNVKFGNVIGSIIGTPTSKTLSINITNIDTTFEYINIIVVQYTGTAYVTKVIKNININNRTTINYKYTGGEGEVDPTIDITDVVISNIKYYASEVIAQKENRLIRGNTKLREANINYQAIANNINVTYNITEDLIFNDQLVNYPTKDNISYNVMDNNYQRMTTSPGYLSALGSNLHQSKSFMRDEVYSLGVGFELADGTETSVFHIPGRLPNIVPTTGIGELGYFPSAIVDWDTNEQGTGEARWKRFNTAVQSPNTLAYWRSTETYPDDYNYPTTGELDETGRAYIRHHKMPSDVLEPTYRTEITGNPNTANTSVNYKLYRRNLGLLVTNIVIPEEYRTQIKKVKIYYTPREDENKSIKAKGLMYPLRNNTGSPKRQPVHLSYEDSTDNQRYYEFKSPDTQFRFKDLNLASTKIRVVGVDKAYVNYVGRVAPGDVYFLSMYNQQAKNVYDLEQRLYTGMAFYNQRSYWKGDQDLFRNVEKSIYVDQNFAGTTEGLNLDFNGGQDTVVIALSEDLKYFATGQNATTTYPELQYPGTARESLLPNLLNQATVATIGTASPNYVNNVYYDTAYYVELLSSSDSLYSGILDLTYIDTKNYALVNNDSITGVTVTNGDTFIDTFSFKSTFRNVVSPQTDAITTDNQTVPVNEIFVQTIASFVAESQLNIRMRNVGDFSDNTNDQRFAPKRFYDINNLIEYGQSAISKEYYNIQDAYNIQNIQLYYANTKSQTDFISNTDDIRYANRLVYSEKQNPESKIEAYKELKVNNYRDIPSDKGPITGLFTRQQNLYATTRDSLFNIYASNQTIQTESGDNIAVGTGEFFGLEPTEPISIKGGFGGTSSKFSISETPYGYVFVDRYKNKVILFDDSLKDLNILGLNEDFNLFLFKQLPGLDTGFDNPISVGITSVFDPLRDRVIITKKDYKLLDLSGALTYNNGFVYRNGVKLDYKNRDVFEDKSITVSYDLLNKKWISYHNYIPKGYLAHPTNFIRFDNSNLGISEGNTYLDFIMETVFNEYPASEKVTDSITTNLVSSTDDQRDNKFFEQALLYNDHQISNTLNLNTIITKKEHDWNFNKFLDMSTVNNSKLFTNDWNIIKSEYPIDKSINPAAINVNKPWYQRGRLRGRYLAVRFTAKNLDLTKIIINFVTSSYRTSER